jgi:hypothetical protein
MEPLLLLRGVRAVATLANPEQPNAATQRAFDAARERSPEHVALPPARRITERLGLPWCEVLLVAHEPEEKQAQLLGVKVKASSDTDWITEEHVAAVLRLVASRLDVDTVSLNEYRVEREKMLSADRARWLHGRRLLLPTDNQIMAAVGSWDAALRLAELQAPRERGPTRKKPNSPTLVDLMERFHDAHGFQPSARDLEAFARGNGIPYPGARPNNAFGTARREWRERRHTAGLSAPRAVRHNGGRGNKAPDYSADVGAALPGERRRDEWDRDACVAAIGRYLAQLRPGERSTSRGYRDWASAQEHAPAMTTIQLHGGWETLRRQAQKHRVVLTLSGG